MANIRIEKDLDPAFIRASTAYKNDGSVVTNGVARYENVVEPIVVDTKAELDRGTYSLCTSSGNVLIMPAPTFTRTTTKIGFDGVTGVINAPVYNGTITDGGTNGILRSQPINAGQTYNFPSGPTFDSAPANLTAIGFSTVISVPATSGSNRFIYPSKAITMNANELVCLSAYITMDDGGAPTVGAGALTGDFSLVINSSVISTINTTLSLGNGVYRVSCYRVVTSDDPNLGIAQYTTQSNRSFKVVGWQLERGVSTPTAYIPTAGAAASRATSLTPTSLNIAEPTENLLKATAFDGESTWTGSTDNGGTMTTNAYSADFAYVGTNSRKLVNTATGWNFYFSGAGNYTLTSSLRFSCSMRVRRADGVAPTFSGCYLYVDRVSDGVDFNQVVVPAVVYDRDGWYRVTWSHTFADLSTIRLLGAVFGNAANVPHYVDAFEVNTGLYTPLRPTAPGTETQRDSFTIPASYVPTDNFTIEFEMTPRKPSGAIVDQASSPMLLQIGTYNGQGSFSLWKYFTSAPLSVYARGTTESSTWSLSNGAASASDTYLAGVTRKLVVRKSGNNIEIWDRGTKYGPFAMTNSITSWGAGAVLRLGGLEASSTSMGDFDFHELRISNIARSDSECASYNSGSVTLAADVNTTYFSNFNGNINFAASGIYTSEWFNVGVSGAIFSGTTINKTEPSGTIVLTEYRTADSDTQVNPSAWSTTLGTGKYAQFRHTLTSSLSTPSLPTVTSTTITPANLGRGLEIEVGTTNLFSSPTVPATQSVTVTPNSDYALRFDGNATSSGSVAIEHVSVETTTSDFNSGSLVNTQGSGNALILATPKADPTFTRATIATKKDLSTVASGVVRYEDVIRQALYTSKADFDGFTKTGPIETSPGGNVALGSWTDGFDIDSSAFYTSVVEAGSATPTFNTAQSRLELTASAANTNAQYTYNDYVGRNVAVEAVVSQAANLGIILRYQDALNYYRIRLDDDTSSSTGNITIQIYSGGSTTTIAGPFNITFTRGTAYKFRVEMVETIIKVFVDDVLVASTTNATIVNPGKVGLFHTNTTASHIHSFKVDTSTPLFACNSVSNNPETGASVTANVPRYMRGKNLLSANQSNVETSASSGFGANNTGTTLTRDTTDFFQGVASLKNVCDGTFNSQGFFAFTQRNLVTGTYTSSAYVKGAGNLRVAISIYYWDGTSTTVASSFTATDTWTRQSASATATAGKSIQWIALTVTTNGAQAVTFNTDAHQVELGATATSWIVGGDSSIIAERGTTNLLAANSENFTSNWNSFDGSVATVTPGQADPFGGTNAYRVECTAGSGTNILKRLIGGGTPASGILHSTSVWIKARTGTVMVNTNLPGNVDVTVSTSNGWRLIKIERLAGNGSAVSQLRLNASAASGSIDCDVMWPQIEVGVTCTTYIAPGTTRSPSSLFLPDRGINSNASMINAASGSVVMRIYCSGDMTQPTMAASRVIFDAYQASTTNRFVLIRTTGGAFQVIGYGPSVQFTSAAYAANPSEGWHLIGMTWGGGTIKLFFDGALRATQTGQTLPTALPYVSIGRSGYDRLDYFDERIDDVSIYPVTLPDATMNALTAL